MSKKELIDILVSDFGWKEENLKNFNIEALEATLKNAKMLKEMEQQLAEQSLFSKQEKVSFEPETKTKRKKKQAISQFEDDDIVEVMNGAPSALIYKDTTDKNGFEYKFEKYGDIEEMSFKEVKMMARRHKKFLKNNWIIILDEDVVKELKLEDIQKDFLTVEDFDEILTKDSKHRIDSVLKAGESTQNAFLRRAIILYKQKKLESVYVLRKIEEHFKVDFEELDIEEED